MTWGICTVGAWQCHNLNSGGQRRVLFAVTFDKKHWNLSWIEGCITNRQKADESAMRVWKEKRVGYIWKSRRHREKENAEVDAQTDSGTHLYGTLEKTSCKYLGWIALYNKKNISCMYLIIAVKLWFKNLEELLFVMVGIDLTSYLSKHSCIAITLSSITFNWLKDFMNQN